MGLSLPSTKDTVLRPFLPRNVDWKFENKLTNFSSWKGRGLCLLFALREPLLLIRDILQKTFHLIIGIAVAIFEPLRGNFDRAKIGCLLTLDSAFVLVLSPFCRTASLTKDLLGAILHPAISLEEF